MKTVTYESLSSSQQKLLDKATEAMERAYSPYSHFYVGAAVRAQDGKIYVGANYETANYDSVHAEQAAIVNANSSGARLLESIAIIGKGEGGPSLKPVVPCGKCRQWITEVSQVSKADIEVICSNTDRTKIIVTKIGALLPEPFGPDDLGVNLDSYRT